MTNEHRIVLAAEVQAVGGDFATCTAEQFLVHGPAAAVDCPGNRASQQT